MTLQKGRSNNFPEAKHLTSSFIMAASSRANSAGRSRKIYEATRQHRNNTKLPSNCRRSEPI